MGEYPLPDPGGPLSAIPSSSTEIANGEIRSVLQGEGEAVDSIKQCGP